MIRNGWLVILSTITNFIKEVKGDQQFYGERIYNMAQNIKFSICTPPIFSRERCLLATGRLLMKTYQRLDGYQFLESLNHKMGRHYVNVLNDERGIPASLLRTPDRYLNGVYGEPLMIHDDQSQIEARMRHKAMWYPKVNDRDKMSQLNINF